MVAVHPLAPTVSTHEVHGLVRRKGASPHGQLIEVSSGVAHIGVDGGVLVAACGGGGALLGYTMVILNIVKIQSSFIFDSQPPSNTVRKYDLSNFVGGGKW